MANSDPVEALNQLLTSSDEDDKKKKKKKGEFGRQKLGGGFKYCLCSPLFREDSHFG